MSGGMWFEVVAVHHKGDEEVRDIEGNHVYIRGHIDDMLVIQVPTGVDHNTILAGIQRMLTKEGIDKGVFVIDREIEMMKLKLVERSKSKVMEAKYQEIRARNRAELAKPYQNAPTTKTRQ
jgi:hypothetical protein